MQTRRAGRASAPWLERLGRLGHAAHGALYGTVGFLAAQAALGAGGMATDPEGVMDWVVTAWYGRLLLGVMGAGLVGYVVWRFVQAARDTEGKGTSPAGILTRASQVGSGLVYAGLALSALQLSLATRGPVEHDAVQDGTAGLMGLPFGEALVGVAGGVMLVVAGAQVYLGYRADFRRNLKREAMSPSLERLIVGLGRLGYAARAVIFSGIGASAIAAAFARDPEQAHGLGGALAALVQPAVGPWLLLTVAGGLMAYGLFELLEARYRYMVLR